ncbi:putative metalloprotease CJM1_0395 family protein [Aliarcobacter lanthieri]|uniref:putative metalloprotease CJM1_0395 family protein n=1 Tax=Aliarcobacter lanthieri TaxID=1355374 RepID=UPI00047A1FE2|nr:putative metalloprotease CJM1_0395 family protein [Aliarcobacter lanthieri]
MDIQNDYLSTSLIYSQLALKNSQLSSIDKKEFEKSIQNSNNDINNLDKNYDERDYQRVLNRFQNRDSEVKAHEQLHASLATTTTPINYDYQVGPDGKLYAIGGSVRLDTSIPKDESAAIQKLDELKKAAAAPEGLSQADSSIAQRSNLNKLLLQSLQEGIENENR